MRTDDIARSLADLFRELADGPPGDAAFILNRGDRGLLAALDGVGADVASQSIAGGATVAAHVAHLQYGLSLMNRWAEGENPFADADWAAAWQTRAVDEAQWATLRAGLRRESSLWHTVLQTPREVNDLELDGVIASVAHLAYHLGALRQIAPALRGPREPAAIPETGERTTG